jgi:hypothetical protein
VLIRDQADRDAIASQLMRYRDQNGQDWADIIDFLTMYPEVRRRVTRLLGRSRPGSISRRSRIEGVGGERQLREARRVAHGLRRPLFALGFSVRVMGSTSEATAANGLLGVVVSLIVLAVGSFLVVRFRTS